MRPTRLELHGFTAFREPVSVDFGGADLFALVGPTGAGKSSVIDGICFGLYGTVPRLDRRAVDPVVSSGRLEARVRLDFTVGERAYTAVRVVRRLPRGGASTREARLESDGRLLAGDADGVTRAVEGILGLGFTQFTRCVVLPQGEFARFLHDTPKARQELLVRLLEADVYSRMRQEAHTRRVAAGTAAELKRERLAELADATPDALAAAERRTADLERLRRAVDDAQPRLERLVAARAEAEDGARAAAARAQTLEGLDAPEAVESLAGAAADAQAAAQAAERLAADAERAVAEAESALSELPAPRRLEQDRAAHAERAELVGRVDKGAPIVERARSVERAAARELELAASADADAAAELQRVRRDHAAHALAAQLRPGQPCPVCGAVADTLPRLRQPAQLEGAESAAREAAARHGRAQRQLREAAERRARAEQTMETVREALERAERLLRGRPDAAEVERLLTQLAEAERRLARARDAERGARHEARAAAAGAQRARAGAERAWTDFDRARDRLAALGPPPARRSDLTTSWRELVGWARAEADRQRRQSADAARRAEAAAAEAAELGGTLAARCAACGLDVARGRPRDLCADALAAARGERDRLADALRRAETLRREQAALEERAAVAGTLARHLAANRFEQWLLDEAIQRLAAGASAALHELSGGQYSLAVDGQRNFVVVDHRNADERRPARTLSGGETFLASLALALTLADHLTELAVAGSPRLESIFLDEGFGALDPAALDTVAAAIEELGAAGRTVGLVTHVRDLAERLPVRYEVRKAPAGSTVERVAL